MNANNLPGGRDIRDPKLVEMDGRLFLYAISRVPGFHYRDLGGQAWTDPRRVDRRRAYVDRRR